MPKFREYQLAAKHVKSLQWHDQVLFDWVGGGDAYHLDGRFEPRHVNYAYRFDSAIMSPTGNYAVLYERLGTKGILLDRGRIIRELNRSYYQAHVYEYPITFIQLPGGRELLAHCPDEYCRIEFEDAATGERLTSRDEHKPEDIFFSRLAPSPAQRYLLMAGWVWHPWDVVGVYDIQQALIDPTILDGCGDAPRTGAEVCGAGFGDEQTLILVTSDEPIDEGDEIDDDDPLWKSGPQSLAYYDLPSREFRSIVHTEDIVGKFMPVGSRYLVGFYEYPKLFDRTTGAVVQRWPELATGKLTSSIQWHAGDIPPSALDSAHRRFAVANADSITVIEIEADK